MWCNIYTQYCGCREQLLAGREREVRAVIRWVLDNPFVLRSGFEGLIVIVMIKFVFSVSFHDGRVMINYPWDDR